MKYEVGDTAWIYCSHHNGEKTKGEVIAVLTLPGYTFEHYVIGIDSAIETLLEIRDDMSMAHSKNEPIGMFKNL